MWKNLSFKKQLIFILLIPISGLIFFTVINIDNTYQKFSRIENSTQRIDEIAHFSEAIMLINNERTFSEYSKFDPSKKSEFELKMAKTLEWFSRVNSKDTVVLKNIDEARKIVNTIHYNTKNKT